jgi:mannose-6-phosphate isomerase-like protein (cupin superfamily)
MHGGEVPMNDIEIILTQMANSFVEKIDNEFTIAVQFDIKELDTPWQVIVEKGRKIHVRQGSCDSAQFYFQSDIRTLRGIMEGKMTGLTAAGKATGSDSAPLDVRPAENLEFDPETRVRLFTFIQHFFNLSNPEKIMLGEKYSRMVHGGHAIPLYYYPGFRSAWYMLKKGERLNEPGDTNPFPQAFVFIEGQGFAKIGDKRIEVTSGESYLVPPGSDHVVWTESDDPLVLIWLAWGEGA